MGLMLNERINALACARKETFRDVGAAGESEGIKAMRLATWSGSVLPALRRAMAEHPILSDAAIKLEGEINDRFEVLISGDGWDRTGYLPRGPLVSAIVGFCEAFARDAAREAGAIPRAPSSFPLLDAPVDRKIIDRQWAQLLGVAPSDPDPMQWPARHDRAAASRGQAEWLRLEVCWPRDDLQVIESRS